MNASTQETFAPSYKGTALRELLAWLEAAFGAEAVRGALRGLPPEQARLFDEGREHYGVLHAGWYPAAAVNALLDALVAGAPAHTQARLVRGAAEATVGRTLRGIYGKLMQLLVSPEVYAKHAQRVWGSYSNNGRIRVRLEGETCSVTTIDLWRGHHPFLCKLNVEAARLIVEAMGLGEADVVRLACVDEGAPACVYRSEWGR